MEHFDFLRVIEFLPGIIIGLTVHEFSHAFVADKCGDSTSKEQGRITLNPFKHIDILGFIMLLVAGFGWAKPVQFNEQNLRNPKRDVIKIAVAGPLSNAVTAIILSLIYVVIRHFIQAYSGNGMIIMNEMFIYGIYINWGLFVFNLIPLPPLDGSHLLLSYFKKYPVVYEGFYKYGSYFFFVLILITMFTKVNLLPIWPVVRYLGDGVLSVFGEIVG